MKDFIQFLALVLVVTGLVVAVPIMGMTVGVGFGLWFLWRAWQEERDAQR